MREFMMWCVIINGGLLLVSASLCMFAGDLLYRLHSIWFPMGRESFNSAVYLVLGVFKVMFLTFNLVPYIAITISGC